MFLKKCPFCGKEIHDNYDNKKFFIKHQCESGLSIKLSANSASELQTNWNYRYIETEHETELGKTTYGYLITQSGDIIKCDESHPEELLKYLGIFTDYQEFDYIKTCRDLNIIRVSIHLSTLAIDLPEKTTEEQLNKLNSLLLSYNKLLQYEVSTIHDNKESLFVFNSFNELLIYLD